MEEENRKMTDLIYIIELQNIRASTHCQRWRDFLTKMIEEEIKNDTTKKKV